MRFDFVRKNYSEEELRRYIKKNHTENLGWVFFHNISKYQTLSEDFIRDFHSNLSWYRISKYQNLSEEFMIEFIERIKIYEWLSVEFVNGRFMATKPDSGGLMSNKLIPEDVKQRIIDLKKVIDQ